MIVSDQAEVIAFLDRAAQSLGAVDVMTTHISRIVLAGDRVFKLKRAVRLPYADFSTPDVRLAACEREVELNRRTAPTLYLGVRRITRAADGLVFDGDGELVDAVVEMERFAQDDLLDHVAEAGRLTGAMLTELAEGVAGFHRDAAVDHSRSGRDNIASVLAINEAALAAQTVFSRSKVADFNTLFRAGLERLAPVLDARERAGKVRLVHGDLHLRNICLIDGRPVPFDCIEFNEAMATIDVLYDLAFLLMDLWHRGLRPQANLVLNRYLDRLDETDGLPVIPYFMALRAAVRAHVTATKADTSGSAQRAAAVGEARGYFDLALALLQPWPVRAVGIGGLSGTGKSTLAAVLAPDIGPPPGARIVSSDRTRKRLLGVGALERLSGEAYRSETSERVYAEVARQVQRITALGHGVIADSVFDRLPDRARIAASAEAHGVRFDGLWLEAPEAVLFERVAGRRHDPSDATTDVVAAQLARHPSVPDWIGIAAGGDIAEVAARVRTELGIGVPPTADL